MAELKARLQADLTTAIKARETVRAGALRMTLAAIQTEQVAGKTARELSDDEVLKVLAREVKKRREAAEAFAGAGRTEQAELERAESAVLEDYLPTPLSDDELATLVDAVIADLTTQLGEKPTLRQMGQVIKEANAKAAGRAEGGRIATTVKAKLA
ncbi:GatB/YqeY domain-containing protein [Saccharothrix violaceirubra]|uniref:GatB/YqeY domain-containing protein n=1 Tax=Saccharothrix violaceirubra TaxID=413306 RepID=A0A7W7T9B4_9PSEU|nr:GatB/YqeY domain-containing protein [Saccharothrix violaceirubra]MBB4968968.1 hypothetical protein [Saccharothrix violaceirubra]